MVSAQDVTEDVIVRNWLQSSTDQKISAIRAGLISPAKRSNALAMVGVALLGVEDRAATQRLFPASSIRPHLLDADPDVAREATRAYLSIEAARQWLTSLAQKPLSVEKFSAVEALVIGTRTPPVSLLPQVMELIRSPQYFCAGNLVISLKKFGSPAAKYLDELIALRAKLEVEAKLPVDDQTVVLYMPFATAASVMDEAIAALQE
jgi:hypothetical protein